ncbi:seryl-tRNA synthetase, putative [Babesia bigemina]|uniref:serine--tRNA ligase n=1 Tax=Babesia bigemina TaxID=5866 RepID=A0A061DEN7_BABBI|nr:seryl-tRNA synthetase, putative [Babesia bigemina]CDR97600.1 seryl-tRNA synthetase, putative [Babesia bigemina]|eukprot:XP_012769786.1 seryl-tRNA synthetase, putative [Babesia bigemina]
MVLDIRYFRNSNLLQLLRASEVRRCVANSMVDSVITADEEWRQANHTYEQAKRNYNDISKRIGLVVSGKAPAVDAEGKPADKAEIISQLKKEAENHKEEIARLLNKAHDLSKTRDSLLRCVGNIVSEDTVPSADEANNLTVAHWEPSKYGWEQFIEANNIQEYRDVACKTVGEHNVKLPPWNVMSHCDVLIKIGGVNLKKGVEIAGHRGYYLMGPGCLLNMALIQYGLDFLSRRGYQPVMPPYFMKKDVMGQCAELADFEETLYCIPPLRDADRSTANEMAGQQQSAGAARDEDYEREKLFLIATSEQPIVALHRNETYSIKELPLKYAGVSTCFRREAGAHGRDLRGIFRIHQFQKIEQFVVCGAEDSWKHHDEMIGVSKEFYESLNLPYRVVSIVAGALNNAAAKKYDLEAYFPEMGDYRELVSCSNCTDYQSCDINSKYFEKDTAQRQYCHMLNGTLVASQRTLCCILENYQTPNGVMVPKALVPYMGGVEFIPFVDGKTAAE